VLVLSRRSNESIRIGADVVVTVLEVHRDHVRLGIEAPRDVEVHRQEVYEAIQQANRLAASSSGGDLSSLGEFLGEKRSGSSGTTRIKHPEPSPLSTAEDDVVEVVVDRGGSQPPQPQS
jgi:carbon storage regulator